MKGTRSAANEMMRSLRIFFAEGSANRFIANRGYRSALVQRLYSRAQDKARSVADLQAYDRNHHMQHGHAKPLRPRGGYRDDRCTEQDDQENHQPDRGAADSPQNEQTGCEPDHGGLPGEGTISDVRSRLCEVRPSGRTPAGRSL